MQKAPSDQSVVLAAGVGALPETVPVYAGRDFSGGAEGKIGYQFSEKVRLEGKYFFSIPSLDNNNGYVDQGLGGIATVKVSSSEELDWYVAGQLQYVLNGDTFEGGGGALQFGAMWKPQGSFFGYALLGPVLGSYDWFDEWGAGATSNIGAGVQVGANFSVTAEAACMAFYDSYLDGTVFLVSPSLQLTFLLPTR